MTDETNAAAELHALLSEWEMVPPQVSILQHRESADGDWWAPHVRAITLLEEVTAQVRRLGKQTRFENTIQRLREGIIVPGQPMVAGAAAETRWFQDEDLAVLEMLQHVAPATPAINAAAATDLLDASRQAEDLVRGAEHLDADAQRYLLELTTHLSKATQQISLFGGAEVRKLASELAGAISAYFGDAPPDQQDQARGLVRRIVVGVKDLFVRDFLPAATKAVASGAAEQWMLPPGTGG